MLQADRRADVPGEDFLDLFALVGVHLDQTADALFLALSNVVDRIASVEFTRVDADEAQLTHEWIGHDLEDQRRKRLAVFRLAHDDLFRVINRMTPHRRNVERRRQIIADCIEQVLHAFVFERRTANDRKNLLRDGGFANTGHQLGFRNRLPLNVFFHQVVVGFRRRFNQFVAIFFGFLE